MSVLLAPDARLLRRRRGELVARGFLLGASLVCLVVLALLLWRLVSVGAQHLGPAFWTSDHSPLGLMGHGASGIRDALLTSIVVLGMAMLFAVPIGTAAGIYLHEYARPSRLTDAIRATVANLAGVPSVVYGLLGLAVFVRLFGMGASNLASALTLGVLVLPILIVATEEALKTVPNTVREASLSLGATKWQTLRSHVVPYSMPGILTGQILALSRAAGETAPLLMLGIPVFSTIVGYGPLESGTPLQVRVYYLTLDPRGSAAGVAAGGIVVLLGATMLLNLLAVLVRERLSRKIRW